MGAFSTPEFLPHLLELQAGIAGDLEAVWHDAAATNLVDIVIAVAFVGGSGRPASLAAFLNATVGRLSFGWHWAWPGLPGSPVWRECLACPGPPEWLGWLA